MISIQNLEPILPESSAVEFFIHGEWNKRINQWEAREMHDLK